MRTFSRNFFTAAAVLAGLTPVAQAHIGYSGRDFGTFTGLEFKSVTIANQAVTGNFGWADAADGNLGDSHKGRAFRFHLDTESFLTLSVSANPTATATSVGGLVPAFSIYQGLAGLAPFPATQTALPSSADHDEAEASLAWRTSFADVNLGLGLDAHATDGSWNALGNWRIGGDGDLPGSFAQLSSFSYKGFGVDFDKNGTADLSTTLPAGDYTIFVGGNDISNKGSADAALAYGVSATLSVGAVPEPQTWALIGAGMGLVAFAQRRSRAMRNAA